MRPAVRAAFWLGFVAWTDLVGHEDVRRQIDAAVGDGGDHGDQLQRRDGDFLADGDGADRGRAASDLTGRSRPRVSPGSSTPERDAESEVADVLVELVGAELERKLDGGDVAGFGERLVATVIDAEAAIALVVVDDAAERW